MIEKSAAELIRECLDALNNLGTKKPVTEAPATQKPATNETEKLDESVFNKNNPYTGPARFTELDEEMHNTLECIKKYDPETYDRIQRWD
jgi:hypothetical protein